jgi:hypothetical protein
MDPDDFKCFVNFVASNQSQLFYPVLAFISAENRTEKSHRITAAGKGKRIVLR